ncbi:hypothetical protein AMIS_80030 [Actinoplanes missouriensis 431]|uniref:DUF4352 domain-containing protein n=1 Tax=Actinoplanes missouriensis (strain ATCC 14538 / DSM 43046 / CBS 188.64 / JCM 3121 / NBRC 102363 / NCIMB 12654 / NRRL B-3342 / UNCC 431) TaxID=512565 RepID=I0HJN6_ACTM4|nr:DUF4352 domain-containing protein [Actinoplanes missouriensis]BAL93223.1 hypothetical protein AMIS_80030 [Actinoplanes missouriensis 431]
MTYAPHRSAPARAVEDYDGLDPGAAALRAKLWIAGGIVAVVALVTFGVWAVVTAEGRPVVVATAAPGGTVAGHFAFAVNGVRCGLESVGPEGLEQRASGHFCLLDVTVKNDGSEPELFDSGAQRAYDADGVAYAPAEQAAVFLNDRYPTLLNEILPGETVTGVLAFDVPSDVELVELSVQGAQSTPGVRITLPPAG